MNSIGDPLESNDMLKLATIYRNGECNYVYVCYHCGCSFVNISDTLSHVEHHFDDKVNIVDGLGEKLTEIVSEKSELDAKLEERVNQVTLSDDDEPVNIEFECKIIEHKFKFEEDYQENTKPRLTVIKSSPPSLHCKLCDQTFNTSPLLSIHLIQDHALTSTLYRCPQCPQRCPDEPTFLSHLQEHIDGEERLVRKVTSNCIQPSVTVEAVNHRWTKYQKAFLKTCDICSLEFSNKKKLISHMLKEHKSKKSILDYYAETVKDPWTKYQRRFLKTCDICSSEFANRRKLISHMKKEHIKKEKCQSRFMKTCDICSSVFTNRKKLISHMKQKHLLKKERGKRRIFDCEKCNQQISGKWNFYAHQYGHMTNGDQVNDLDDEMLRQNLQKFLDDNVYCDESSPNKPFGCRICSHLSSTIRRRTELHVLQSHVYYVKYESNSNNECEHCGMQFANSSNLSQHLQLHTMARPYSCPICSKTFTIKRYVKMHMHTHSDAKPEQCSTCGKTFKTWARLNIHIRTHSDAMAKCKICDKEVKSHRLKQHLQDVHENEHRPYSCSVCLQTFKTSKTLRNHSFRHTGERRHECRFHCTEKFISSAARRAHERSKHEAQ